MQMDPTHDVDRAYEQGYADGLASVRTEWVAALTQVMPSNVACTPAGVSEYLEALQQRVVELQRDLSVKGVDTER